jgi:hypothetical protein
MQNHHKLSLRLFTSTLMTYLPQIWYRIIFPFNAICSELEQFVQFPYSETRALRNIPFSIMDGRGCESQYLDRWLRLIWGLRVSCQVDSTRLIHLWVSDTRHFNSHQLSCWQAMLAMGLNLHFDIPSLDSHF